MENAIIRVGCHVSIKEHDWNIKLSLFLLIIMISFLQNDKRCRRWWGGDEVLVIWQSRNLVVEKPVTLEETKKSLRSIQLIFNYFSIGLGQISARDPDRLEVGRGGIEGVRNENDMREETAYRYRYSCSYIGIGIVVSI